MNKSKLGKITSIEALEMAEEIATENLLAIRKRIEELTQKIQPDEVTLAKYAKEMFIALQMTQDADYANSQPFSLKGLCSPDNPFGQSTVKMQDGRLLDRSDLRRKSADAVQSVIEKICG